MSKQSTETAVASSTWAALDHEVFRRFWIASFVAYIGASFQNVGVAWLMIDLGGSALTVGLVQGVMSLSVLLLALPAGAIADLYDRRGIMLLALAGLTFFTGLIGALALSGHLTQVGLLMLTFAFGIFSAGMTPAMQSLAPQLVSQQSLPSAITLNGMSTSAARSIGPALAGALVGTFGAGRMLACNSLAFLTLFAVIVLWDGGAKTARAVSRLSVTAAMGEGVAHAMQDAGFRTLLVRIVLGFFGVSALLALLPSVVAGRTGAHSVQGAHLLGLLLAAYGVGSVIGSLGLSAFMRRLSRDKLLQISIAMHSLAVLLLSLTSSAALHLAAMCLAGICWTISWTVVNISAQLILPPQLLARGLALSMMALMAALAAGSAVWGAVATHFSLQVALVSSALLGLVMVAGFTILTGPHVPDRQAK